MTAAAVQRRCIRRDGDGSGGERRNHGSFHPQTQNLVVDGVVAAASSSSSHDYFCSKAWPLLPIPIVIINAPNNNKNNSKGVGWVSAFGFRQGSFYSQIVQQQLFQDEGLGIV
ncbi:uncharacterized protein G2W53_008378 [Senna tora]|uniref:Uncharacterized protein n=1 Tax=Senna tora TaxID=362788 RepID=A0A835CFR8_9FABA|nr:uncharacterized protein G2W53_008378 [Senna tora]